MSSFRLLMSSFAFVNSSYQQLKSSYQQLKSSEPFFDVIFSTCEVIFCICKVSWTIFWCRLLHLLTRLLHLWCRLEKAPTFFSLSQADTLLNQTLLSRCKTLILKLVNNWLGTVYTSGFSKANWLWPHRKTNRCRGWRWNRSLNTD